MPSKISIHVAIELKSSSWLTAARVPDATQIRIHRLGDKRTEKLIALTTDLRQRIATKLDEYVEVACCFEAGRDGFWLQRLLSGKGFSTYVLEPGRQSDVLLPDKASEPAEAVLGRARWRSVTWRSGTKGRLKARFAAVRVRVADGPTRRIDGKADQQVKKELGLDQFEGRSRTGLHRHALMTMLAYAFLRHRRLATAGR